MVRRSRLDAELVRRGHARSRGHAGELIDGGHVLVGGVPAGKAATQVGLDQAIVVRTPADEPAYVSRGAHKLAGALDAFGIGASGRRCLDAGASTGGFTDVLLRRGAAAVVAVDVGYGQLAWPLRSDDRVTVLERTNVRELDPEQVGAPMPGLVVGDLSFISLGLVLEPLVRCADAGADFTLMVKPQFEVGKDRWAPEASCASRTCAPKRCGRSPAAPATWVWVRRGWRRVRCPVRRATSSTSCGCARTRPRWRRIACRARSTRARGSPGAGTPIAAARGAHRGARVPEARVERDATSLPPSGRRPFPVAATRDARMWITSLWDTLSCDG